MSDNRDRIHNTLVLTLREEAFRIYLAMLKPRLELIKPEEKLETTDAIHQFNQKCARIALHCVNDFDAAWEKYLGEEKS